MQIPIDADHSNMVKFSDRYDPRYITVRDRLYECVKKAPEIIKNRLAIGAHHGELAISESLFMVPFFGNPDFVGRQDTLDQLEGLLSPKGDDQRRAALCGLGGVG